MDVRVVGRADELRRLSGLVRDACEGRFGTVVVEGDAGIGKTTLVRAACEAAGEGALVLSGACLPLTSVAVPYLGLRSAVRGLPAEARPRVAEWGTAGTGNDEPATPVPLAVDDWLSTQCEKRPVVLVVDDLQWADQETLDVLMYLVAGPPDRALAMVMTVRTEEVGTDHRLSGWLADARRMPGVESIAVPPMTREEVADVAARELGGQPHVSLVDDLDELSGGNPYLAKLLLEGLDPSSRTIPERWPGALREAVLRSWHRLSSEARRLTVLLAVDGTTAGSADLDRLADIASVAEPARAVDEAVAAGVLELRADETYWFHHPLYAELIEQQLPPGERRELHGLFASYHEAAAGDSAPFGPPFAEQMSDRYHAAGQPAAAYRWALRAADAVGPVLQDRRRFRMLRRAAWLRLQVPEAEESQEGLWAELRSAAEAVGELDPELEAVDQLLSLMDDGREPLDRAVLLARRAVLWRVTGRGSGIGDLEHAERLTAAAPQSWQRLFVLPECMAAALFVDGDTQRGERLLAEVRHLLEVYQEPVQDGDWLRARTRAQAMALLAMALTTQGDRAECAAVAKEAFDAADAVRDASSMMVASSAEAYAAGGPGTRAYAEVRRSRRRRAESIGLPAEYVAWLSAAEALPWVVLGDPTKGEERLRVALGVGTGPSGDFSGRLVAATLATRQGRQHEAEEHLRRAAEIFAGYAHSPNYHFPVVSAEVHLGAGRHGLAAETAMSAARARGPRSVCSEWLLPLAAQALADLAQAQRDAGSRAPDALNQLSALRAEFPRVVGELETARSADPRALVPALQALYDAEAARAQSTSSADVWRSARDALAGAGLRWEQCYASWRLAESLLGQSSAEIRTEAAEALRAGHALAGDLGARPMTERIEALARAARIRLDVIASADGSPVGDADGEGPTLTRREREVLAHVVAGRTYAEIAGALFLSEKTVSSHISNILRKTGAANRVELAAWATRVGSDQR